MLRNADDMGHLCERRAACPGGRPAAGRHRGFSAVDLTVALLIAGMLASVAYPSYRVQMHKGRRSDAIASLAALQLAQERYRSTAARYADDVAHLGLAAYSGAGHYELSIHDASATGYTLVASAWAGSTQAHDRECTRMAIAVRAGLTLHLASGESDELTEDLNRRCWPT